MRRSALWPLLVAALAACAPAAPSAPPRPPATEAPGARPVAPTPLERGTLFAAPAGSGEACSEAEPCALETAVRRLAPGDVLFLRGGVYARRDTLYVRAAGDAEHPIVIESYPGERAVLEGEFRSPARIRDHHRYYYGIRLTEASRYVQLRRLEVRYMGDSGIGVFGDHDLVEGCEAHHNVLSGILVYGGPWREDDPDYATPYRHGFNVVRDNLAHDNSDVELASRGGNADGIAVSSGRLNQIVHNEVWGNSDDGIDTWRSNDAYVAYNVAHRNGLARGDGNGIKAGGNLSETATNGLRTRVEHNLAYQNRARGFDFNAGKDVVFRFNTAWANGGPGFTGGADTLMEHNLARDNAEPARTGGPARHNSWQTAGTPAFVSTDPGAPGFLQPRPGPFAGMGAYAGEKAPPHHLFILGDSTVHNPESRGSGWGDVLGEFLLEPERALNRARSGASSKSYKDNNRYRSWQRTLEEMDHLARPGDYLLIQFGHNDESHRPELHTDPGRGGSFYRELKVYVDEARRRGMVPVLVTPLERFYKERRTHGAYPDTVRALAADEGALLLDLNAKSYAAFAGYPDSDAIVARFGYKDHTHTNHAGARLVAGWLKALACRSPDLALCAQFR